MTSDQQRADCNGFENRNVKRDKAIYRNAADGIVKQSGGPWRVSSIILRMGILDGKVAAITGAS